MASSGVQVQARGPPSEHDPTIAGHLLRLRDERGKPLSDERLHAEFGVMFIGGDVASSYKSNADRVWRPVPGCLICTCACLLAECCRLAGCSSLQKVKQEPSLHAQLGLPCRHRHHWTYHRQHPVSLDPCCSSIAFARRWLQLVAKSGP